LEKPDANRVSTAIFCVRAKEGTITHKHTKRSKSSRNWTVTSRKEPRKFDRTNLNSKPSLTEAEELRDVQVSRPVNCTGIVEREDREHDLETALQCEHFQKCSGCTREWRLDQPIILKEAKNFFDDHGVPDFTFTSGSLWEWRCRGKLAVRGTSENPQIGLYQEGTHNVVDIPYCRAHHPKINSAVQLLKEAIRELNVQPYDEVSGVGDLRYVQMALTSYNTSLPSAERYSNGKVQVALVWNSRNEISFSARKLASLSKFLWTKGGPMSVKHFIHSVWANFQTSRSNIIFGGRWRHLVGEQEFWEHIGGVDICLAPASFGQANTQAFNSLIYKLCKYVKHGSSVVELYAGVGIIGLSLASSRKCRSVKCVEINKESKLPFEKSLARLPKTLDCSISWHCADVSVAPIHWLEGSDIVVVDPPRKGLDASVIDALQIASLRGQEAIEVLNRVEKRPWLVRAQQASVKKESKTNWDETASWPEALIYVSCGWESFKQDCRALLSNKAWHLENAHAFNFFPGTDSIEVLAIFKRGQPKKPKKKHSKKTRT
jgi:tRNA/tmRNA/rRNA uracil-C5-methylase (TrmA/RlmC/RlmD family)